MRPLNLHRDDLKTLVAALATAASRHESMDRAGVGIRRGANHAKIAEQMRKLRANLSLTLNENPGERDFAMGPRP
ncbi:MULTISPECIES: hypothetical protein [unclassified Bradyrhizobium]|uniref:hypothetical protein n=1 Tax=unclassified Bradyrhizobium TaxID=2631580 RepID=UPI0029161F3C|nr:MULTISPECIES: hypothetical protein [unclassified Bradyrhizobium]